MADMFLPDDGAAVTKAGKPKSREAISTAMRFHIMRRDNFTCQYCGAQAPDAALHVDHITPVVRGGTNDPANLLVACVRCNLGKSARNATSDDERPLTERERKLQWRYEWFQAQQRRLSWIYDLPVSLEAKAVLFCLSAGADPGGTAMLFEAELARACAIPLNECRSIVRGLEAVGYLVPMEGHLSPLCGGTHLSVNINADRAEREFDQPPKRPAYADFIGDFLPTVERVYG